MKRKLNEIKRNRWQRNCSHLKQTRDCSASPGRLDNLSTLKENFILGTRSERELGQIDVQVAILGDTKIAHYSDV